MLSSSALAARFATYYKRHGALATVRRAGLAIRRLLFFSRQIVFYCDLSKYPSDKESEPSPFKIERKSSSSELNPRDLQEIVSFWNPVLAQRNIEQRLNQGASLWLIKCGERLAGYGWTLQARTIEPYYFPLGSEDVHFFDFYVFPQYRGRGINPLLVAHILRSIASECRGRAFIETAEWNEAQLVSLAKTAFCRLGSTRRLAIFGRAIIWWDAA